MQRDRIIGETEAKARAKARIVDAVSRLTVLGLRPLAISARLQAEQRDILDVLGCVGEPSIIQVRAWARAGAEQVSTLVDDVKGARAMAVARLDCTLAPLITRIEAAAEAGEADLRAIEQLRRVVATQAEIQGVTRARESLADALETAMRSLVERSQREGTIRSAAPNPPALRAGSGRISYRNTEPDAITLEAERADRRPGAIASTLANSGADVAVIAAETAKARARVEKSNDLA